MRIVFLHDLADRVFKLLSGGLRVEHDLSDRAYTVIREIFGLDRPRATWTRLYFPSTGTTVEMESKSMNVSLQPGEAAVATATFKHPRTGQPVNVEDVEWTSEDESIATVVPDPHDDSDPAQTGRYTATVTANSDPASEGSAVIHCNSDTIVGEGESRLDLVGTVIIPPDNTVVGEINFGTPTSAA